MAFGFDTRTSDIGLVLLDNGWRAELPSSTESSKTAIAQSSFSSGVHRWEVHITNNGGSSEITIGVCEDSCQRCWGVSSTGGVLTGSPLGAENEHANSTPKLTKLFGWRDIVKVELVLPTTTNNQSCLSFGVNGHPLGQIDISSLYCTEPRSLSPFIRLGGGCQVAWRILDEQDHVLESDPDIVFKVWRRDLTEFKETQAQVWCWSNFLVKQACLPKSATFLLLSDGCGFAVCCALRCSCYIG
jgi:hypothetical protein